MKRDSDHGLAKQLGSVDASYPAKRDLTMMSRFSEIFGDWMWDGPQVILVWFEGNC